MKKVEKTNFHILLIASINRVNVALRKQIKSIENNKR